MKLALGIEYDGRAFCGWQSQPNGCGVQDALERALSVLADSPITTIAAGRTDAGVHATGQVVHIETDTMRPTTAWVRGTNAHLPEAVRVLWAVPVAADFHARFSAHSRSYDYLLYSHPIRPALMAGRVGWFHAPLDVERMQQAAELLLGEHDFSCFRAAQCQAKTPVKTLTEASVERRGDLICLRFTANAFLHHMVRNMVGCLVYVGAGRQPVAWMDTVLKTRDRALAAPTFAPDGLYLVRVGYPQPIDIPAGSPILTASFP